MAREGLFQDLDAAPHRHPGPLARVTNFRSPAVDQMKIEFFGKSSHAAGGPWLGHSAVDAAELCAHSVVYTKFVGKADVLTIVLSVQMFPPIALVGPLYVFFTGTINVYNTYVALIIPYLVIEHSDAFGSGDRSLYRL